MTSDRIKEIQMGTPYPHSTSVQQALLQVWNECEQDTQKKEKLIEVGSKWVGKGYGDKVKVIEVKDGNVTLSCKKYTKTDDNSLPIAVFLGLFTPRQPKPIKKQKLVKFLEFVDKKMCHLDINLEYIVEQYFQYLEHLNQK